MKKTAYILILIFIASAVALFSFSSCKNDPAPVPTEAPEPGSVPKIPNDTTPLSKLGGDAITAFDDLFEGLGRFFTDYTDKYEDSLDSFEDGEISLSSPLSITAPDGDGSFRDNDFSYSDFKAEIKPVDVDPTEEVDDEFFLIVSAKVSSEALELDEQIVRMEYNLMEDDDYYFYYGSNAIPEFSVINHDHEINKYYYYPEGSKTCLNNSSDQYYPENPDEESLAAKLDEVKELSDYFMFIGYKAMSQATVNLSGLSASIELDESNILTIETDGKIQLSGKYLSDEEINTNNNITFFYDPVDDLFSSFSATASDLTLTATLSTSAVVDTKTLSETLSATITIEGLKLSTVYETDDEDESTTVSFKKLSLSLSNADKSIKLSFEASDFSMSCLDSYDGLLVKASAMLGFGVKIDDSSVGLVMDFEMKTGIATGIPYMEFTPKALVINGSYYEPDEIKNEMIDYVDVLSAFLVTRLHHSID